MTYDRWIDCFSLSQEHVAELMRVLAGLGAYKAIVSPCDYCDKRLDVTVYGRSAGGNGYEELLGILSAVEASGMPDSSREELVAVLRRHIDYRKHDSNTGKATVLKRMDDVMSFITDEEEPAIGRWKAFGIPDEASVEYIKELLDDDEDLYDTCCRIFAEEISRVIAKGEWTKDGWTAEFYNSKHDQSLKQTRKEIDNEWK